jgi:TnpA family transposase
LGSATTRLRHERLILDFYGFRPFDSTAKSFVAGEIEKLARSQLQPALILWRIVDSLVKEKIEIPGYYPLAELILAAVNTRKAELCAIIERALTARTREALDELLVQGSAGEDEPVPAKTAAYKLTLLKKLSQSTKPSKIRETITDLLVVQGLYRDFLPILCALDLNHEGIRYYAHSVIKSEIFQVTRRISEDRYLHLIAFITHQYFRLQDNLFDVLLNVLQTYLNTAQREHKEVCYRRREHWNEAVRKLIGYLDHSFLKVLSAIKQITDSAELDDAEKVRQIRALLATEEPDRHQAEASLAPLKRDLESETDGEDYYGILEAKSVRIQNRISPILKALPFQGEAGSEALLRAIQYFKDKDGVVDRGAPTEFLKPIEEKAVLGRDGDLRVSLYKALLFIHVMGAIKSGTLNLEHSYKYRTLDNYMIDRDRWQRDKQTLLARAGLASFAEPQQVLDELDRVLHAQYVKTNMNLVEGNNSWVKLNKDNTITISTPKVEDADAAPLQTFFPERDYISLLEVLSTVNRYSGFLDEFQHWQQRYHRPKPPQKTFYAGIIGLGCGIGTRKIARISRQISEPELENTVNWYFSPDATQAANDKVLHLMDRMELPNRYRRSQEVLHTSSDGQKFEVKVESLNANHSFKYFGKGKGVSVYSFIDERHLLFHSTVISAAERESAYVIDGLMHNDVVKSDVHSTDTHGYSEMIFGTMHLLGFSYAPRIKNLKRQRLYTFKSRRSWDRAQAKVAPSGYIDTQIIEDNWDDILRFIATIKLKETTASEIFRRLNSYSKQHALYRALKTFGKIIKSIFILRYIDDLELRQAIEKQLNKIENSHQFSRAVSIGNPREFTQAEKQEQEVAEGCKRLIKNAITCWNYLYLSQKISEVIGSEAREILFQAIANGSVVSWQHINLLGEYDFSDEKLQDSVGIKPPKLAA